MAHPCRRCLSDSIPTPLMLVRGAPEAGQYLSRHRDLGHLKRDVAAVADDLRTDLDQLLPQTRQPASGREGRAANGVVFRMLAMIPSN